MFATGRWGMCLFANTTSFSPPLPSDVTLLHQRHTRTHAQTHTLCLASISSSNSCFFGLTHRYHAVQMLKGKCPSAKLCYIVEPWFMGAGTFIKNQESIVYGCQSVGQSPASSGQCGKSRCVGRKKISRNDDSVLNPVTCQSI
jgi:hypothetical protein